MRLVPHTQPVSGMNPQQLDGEAEGQPGESWLCVHLMLNSQFGNLVLLGCFSHSLQRPCPLYRKGPCTWSTYSNLGAAFSFLSSSLPALFPPSTSTQTGKEKGPNVYRLRQREGRAALPRALGV